MIIRMVQMVFREDRVNDFKEFIRGISGTIRDFPGCQHLDILQDIKHKNVFFSHSIWISEKTLDLYRRSDFFNETWSQVKKWFSEKPRAWSLEKIGME